MAAPSFVSAGTGVIIQTGSSAITKTVTVGNFVLLHALIDGTGSTPAISSISGVADIAGAASSLTFFMSPGGDAITLGSVGPEAAGQFAWVGRATSTSISATLAVNAAGNDLYTRWYEFTNVNAGTANSDVLENGAQADFATLSTGISTTLADADVTTNDVDRLAVNIVGINDDATGLDQFTGMTGGTWSAFTTFESATGTDGTIAICTAAMASAGTIDGGTDVITSDAWGVVGFALIGTTVGGSAASLVLPNQSQRLMRRRSVLRR